MQKNATCLLVDSFGTGRASRSIQFNDTAAHFWFDADKQRCLQGERQRVERFVDSRSLLPHHVSSGKTIKGARLPHPNHPSDFICCALVASCRHPKIRRTDGAGQQKTSVPYASSKFNSASKLHRRNHQPNARVNFIHMSATTWTSATVPLLGNEFSVNSNDNSSLMHLLSFAVVCSL